LNCNIHTGFPAPGKPVIEQIAGEQEAKTIPLLKQRISIATVNSNQASEPIVYDTFSIAIKKN